MYNISTYDYAQKTAEFNYDEALSDVRRSAHVLKEELEAKILGKTIPAWGGCCGEIFFREAIAVEIRPPGEDSEYHIADQTQWTVYMEETSGLFKSYSCGLTEFLPRDEIQIIFDSNFEGIDIQRLNREYLARKVH